RFLRQVPGRVRGARVDSGRIIAHASLLLCGVGCSGPRVSGGGAGYNHPPPGQLIAAWWASMIANSKAMTSAVVLPPSSNSWALAMRSTLLEPSITRAAKSASSAFMVSSLGTLSGASPPCGVPQVYIIPEGKANPSPPRATRAGAPRPRRAGYRNIDSQPPPIASAPGGGCCIQYATDTPYSACSGVNPSYPNWSTRPCLENEVKSRYDAADRAACSFQSAPTFATAYSAASGP